MTRLAQLFIPCQQSKSQMNSSGNSDKLRCRVAKLNNKSATEIVTESTNHNVTT